MEHECLAGYDSDEVREVAFEVSFESLIAKNGGGAVDAAAVGVGGVSLFDEEGHGLHAEADHVSWAVGGDEGGDGGPVEGVVPGGPLVSASRH